MTVTILATPFLGGFLVQSEGIRKLVVLVLRSSCEASARYTCMYIHEWHGAYISIKVLHAIKVIPASLDFQPLLVLGAFLRRLASPLLRLFALFPRREGHRFSIF